MRACLLHYLRARLHNGYMQAYVQIMQHTHYLRIGSRITIMQSHTQTMQQAHTHKTVTGGVEAKKLLSRGRQSEYRREQERASARVWGICKSPINRASLFHLIIAHGVKRDFEHVEEIFDERCNSLPQSCMGPRTLILGTVYSLTPASTYDARSKIDWFKRFVEHQILLFFIYSKL